MEEVQTVMYNEKERRTAGILADVVEEMDRTGPTPVDTEAWKVSRRVLVQLAAMLVDCIEDGDVWNEQKQAERNSVGNRYGISLGRTEDQGYTYTNDRRCRQR